MRNCAILIIWLTAALCLPAAAQGNHAPPAQAAGGGPSLDVTMQFIQEKLSSVGQLDFSQQFSDDTANNNVSIELGNVQADPHLCSIRFHWKAWFDGDVSQKNERDINVPLHDIVDVRVEPYEEYVTDLPSKWPAHETSTSPRVAALVLSGANVVESQSDPNQWGVANIYVFPLLNATLADRLRKAVTHAVELCGGGSQSPRSSVAAAEGLPEVLPMLTASLSQEIVFSRDELSKLGSDARSRLKEANRDSAIDAAVLAETAERVFGKRDPRVELAFQRSCALPYDQNHFTNFCERLGDFYERRGDLQLALAIYTRAPKCQASEGAGAKWGPPCQTRAADLYLRLGDRDSARALYGTVCSNYSIPYSCEQFARLGGNVDLGAQRARYAANIQREDEQRQEEKEERKEQARERNQRFDSLMGALRSMPGDDDSLAIIHSVNHSYPEAGGIQATQPPPATKADVESKANSASSVTTEACPSTQTYPDAGLHCNAVRSELACIKVVEAIWHPSTAIDDGSREATFENVCDFPVRLTAWGPKGGSNAGETLNIGSRKRYTFSNDRERYEYQADDGVDCSGNNLRPGCSDIGR